jgi:hypothetical protein
LNLPELCGDFALRLFEEAFEGSVEEVGVIRGRQVCDAVKDYLKTPFRPAGLIRTYRRLAAARQAPWTSR